MELILKYFPNLTDDQIDKFTKLESLYQDWNLKINVVSRKDIDELYLRHVLHALAIAKVINFKDGTKLLDVGTGGGFPGNNELKNGILYLKGGDLTEELKDYKTTTIYNLKDFYEEDFYETKKVVHLPMKYRS